MLAAGHISAPFGNSEGGPGSQLSAAKLLPAGDDSALAIAWQSYRDTRTGHSDEIIETAALGPVGTVTVEWTGPEGVSSSPAQNTLASTTRTDVEKVRFLDASGAVVGESAVLPPEAMSGSDLPRETMSSWILPEVRQILTTS